MKPRIAISASPVTHDRRACVKVNQGYVEAVVRAGAIPVLVPVLAAGLAGEILSGLDGLLLPGGGDISPACYREAPVPEVYDVSPARDHWELALIAAAGLAGLPVLGVCRGAQMLNVAAGGSLVQHLPAVSDEPHSRRDQESDEVHQVGIEPGSLLAAVVGPERLGVNSLHHQGVARLGRGLRPVAWAGGGVIEAIESTDDLAVLGVQWHPELMTDHPRHRLLFEWLARVAAAGARAA